MSRKRIGPTGRRLALPSTPVDPFIEQSEDFGDLQDLLAEIPGVEDAQDATMLVTWRIIAEAARLGRHEPGTIPGRPRALARVCRWRHDPEALRSALIDSGWLRETDDPERLYLVSWPGWGGRVLAQRDYDTSRKGNQRDKPIVPPGQTVGLRPDSDRTDTGTPTVCPTACPAVGEGEGEGEDPLPTEGVPPTPREAGAEPPNLSAKATEPPPSRALHLPLFLGARTRPPDEPEPPGLSRNPPTVDLATGYYPDEVVGLGIPHWGRPGPGAQRRLARMAVLPGAQLAEALAATARKGAREPWFFFLRCIEGDVDEPERGVSLEDARAMVGGEA